MRALIAIITGLTVSLASFGTEKKLGAISAAAPNQTCETVLFGSQEALYHQVFSSWAQNYQDGIATRGYMGNAIANTPLSNRIALEYGILFWGIAFRLVPNVEAAQAHRQKVYEYNKKKNALLTDQIVTSIYIIGDEKELNITFDAEGTGAVRKPVDPKIVKSILSRGGIEISETGEITHYTGTQLQNRISANSVDFNNVAHLPSTGHMNSLSQSGWVTFKKHGIHDFEHWKSKDSYLRLEKLAMHLLDLGYTFRFNQDPKACLTMLAKQKRTYSDEVENDEGQKVKVRKTHSDGMNRYSKDEVFNTVLERLLAGEGYTAEIYSPDGVLVGGEVGFRNGNHFYGDSVFYDSDRFTDKKIDGFEAQDLAKVAGAMFMKFLAENGQPYTDPGMITPYTASMDAQLIPYPEYRVKVTSGPKELIQLPKQTDIRTEEYWRKTFSAIAGRPDRMFTVQRLLTQFPQPTGPYSQLSSEYGLTRKKLNVVFVPTLEDAQADVVNFKTPEELPLYLIGNFKSDRARDIPGGLVKAVYFKNSRFPNHFQELTLKRVRELIGEDTSDIEVDSSRAWTTMKVPVWAI